MGIFSGWFKGPEVSINSLTFNTQGFESRGEVQPGAARAWFSPEGDGVGLFFFNKQPDLPQGATSEGLMDFYQTSLASVGGKAVEVRIVSVAQLKAVHTLITVPQQVGGWTYVGSLTIPLRDFSFVLKCQCEEHGITGIREAVLTDRCLAKDANTMPRSDYFYLEVHDQEFPKHPLSRARRMLEHFARTLSLDEAVRKAPSFNLAE